MKILRKSFLAGNSFASAGSFYSARLHHSDGKGNFTVLVPERGCIIGYSKVILKEDFSYSSFSSNRSLGIVLSFPAPAKDMAGQTGSLSGTKEVRSEIIEKNKCVERITIFLSIQWLAFNFPGLQKKYGQLCALLECSTLLLKAANGYWYLNDLFLLMQKMHGLTAPVLTVKRYLFILLDDLFTRISRSPKYRSSKRIRFAGLTVLPVDSGKQTPRSNINAFSRTFSKYYPAG